MIIKHLDKEPVIDTSSFIAPNVFIATGASIFHGATLRTGSEVSINGVVHLKTELPQDTSVPINWIAVGTPVKILPPDKHDEIWAIQKPLNFPLSVYGIDRPKTGEPNNMIEICKVMSDRLKSHIDNEIIDKE